MSERRQGLRRGEDVTARDVIPRSRARLALLGVCIGLGLFAALQIASCQRQAALDAARYADCREGNIPNAYIQLVLERIHFDYRKARVPSPRRALPILSCEQTVEQDRAIRLSPVEERRYLKVFVSGQLPRVRDGRVVGADRFPAAEPRH